MVAGAVVVDEVTWCLGWPRDVTPDPAIGWPDVPRETIDWPDRAPTRVSAEAVRAVPGPTKGPPEPAAALTVTDPPAIRPPGPRRARFDEDEIGPPVATEPERPPVSRETPAPVPAFPAPAATRIFVWYRTRRKTRACADTLSRARADARGNE